MATPQNPGGDDDRALRAGRFLRACRGQPTDTIGHLQAQAQAQALAGCGALQLFDSRAGTLARALRDQLGDWRVCQHSPCGARVHAPSALARSGRR